MYFGFLGKDKKGGKPANTRCVKQGSFGGYHFSVVSQMNEGIEVMFRGNGNGLKLAGRPGGLVEVFSLKWLDAFALSNRQRIILPDSGFPSCQFPGCLRSVSQNGQFHYQTEIRLCIVLYMHVVSFDGEGEVEEIPKNAILPFCAWHADEFPERWTVAFLPSDRPQHIFKLAVAALELCLAPIDSQKSSAFISRSKTRELVMMRAPVAVR